MSREILLLVDALVYANLGLLDAALRRRSAARR